MSNLKFLANGMLGKLTRWLRMLGQDVKYSSNLDDEALIKLAKSEKRILLTRDLQLHQRAKTQQVNTFLVEGKSESEHLASLARHFDLNLEFDPDSSRCPVCNDRIRPAEKQQIIDKIPINTKIHYEEFWECRTCGKIYWQGAHWKKIGKTLEEAREIMEKS